MYIREWLAMVVNVVAGAKRAPHSPRVLVALLFALFSACAWSQTQLATVSGSISDPSGAVISEATVAILNQSTGLKREIRTRAAGEYRFAGLPTGNYVLRVEKEG